MLTSSHWTRAAAPVGAVPVTTMARKLLRVPATFVSVVETDFDVYISHDGLPEPLATTRRLEGATFCHLAIASAGPLVIPDTHAHALYRRIPTVDSLGVAAYLGVPLRLPSGDAFGAFCAIDTEPRDWSATDVEVLVELAEAAEREIALRGRLAVAESEALTDSLTEVANKRAFKRAVAALTADAVRDGTKLAVILFDIDHFKAVNDRHGHAIGDRVLTQVAALASQIVRSSDLVARYGGEEFVVLLPGASSAEAKRIAEKLRALIESAPLQPTLKVTASFGTAVLPDDATGPAGLLRAADQALYAAKRRGRNRVVSATELAEDPRDPSQRHRAATTPPIGVTRSSPAHLNRDIAFTLTIPPSRRPPRRARHATQATKRSRRFDSHLKALERGHSHRVREPRAGAHLAGERSAASSVERLAQPVLGQALGEIARRRPPPPRRCRPQLLLDLAPVRQPVLRVPRRPALALDANA